MRILFSTFYYASYLSSYYKSKLISTAVDGCGVRVCVLNTKIVARWYGIFVKVETSRRVRGLPWCS